MRWLLPALTATVLACHGQTEKSVFTALGIEPAKLGEAWVRNPPRVDPNFLPWQFDSEPDPFALVVLPATPAERQQLLDAMLAKPQALPAAQRLFVAELLEGWGRADEALALVEMKGAPEIDPLHLVRLRFRKGDLDGAAAAFVTAQDPARPEAVGYLAMNRRAAAFVRPFVALGQFPELAKLLAWLQPRSQNVTFRAEILKLRLEVAWHTGKSAELIAQLQRESPVLRQAAEWLLTLDPTKLPPQLDDLPPGDLLLLYRVARDVPAVTGAIRKLVADGRGSPADHTELFRQLIATRTRDTEKLLADWLMHDENCLPVLAATLAQLPSPGSLDLPAEALSALADRHLEHLPANLLAGLAMREKRRSVGKTAEWVADPADKFLQRAMQAPLLVDLTGEFADSSSFLPRSPADIAGMALAAQSVTMDPQELLEMLTTHPGFTELPVRERARYFAIAKLDVHFVETLLKLDWADPANDRCGGWLGRYLASIPDRQPSADALWQRLVAAMPVMLAGSPDKSESRIYQDARLLQSQLLRLNPTDPGFAPILAALRERSGDNARAAAEQLTEKYQPEAPIYRPDLLRTQDGSADPVRCLSWFAPERMIRWVESGLPREIVLFAISRNSGPVGSLDLLAARFPWLAQRSAVLLRPLPQDLEVLWKLRRLLSSDSPQAIACDLGIVLHLLPKAPDDLAAIAKQHVATVLENPRELDFLLFKMLAPQPVGQAGPDWRPGQPIDLSGLAVLTSAPAQVRNQAAMALAALARGNPAMPQLATLEKNLRQGIITQETMNPAPDREAAHDQLQRHRQLGKQAGPEARALAKKVLREYLARGERETTGTENIAISILVETGEFEAFLKEIAAQYRDQPGGELACAKAMHALHQYKIVHSHGESAAFAKQVFALDSNDVPAATEVAFAAVAAGDLAGLMAALPALRKGDPAMLMTVLSSERALAILPREAVPRLLEILALPTRAVSGATWRMRDITALRWAALHQYFDAADPQMGTRFRELIVAAGWVAPEFIVPVFVNELIRAEPRPEAVSLLVAIVTGTGKTLAPGATLRFPAKSKPPFEWSTSQLCVFNCAVSAKLCQAVLEQLPATPTTAVPAEFLALLRYAATPTAEVFNAAVVPLLAIRESAERAQAIQRLIALLQSIPGAEGRQRLLDEASLAANPRPANSSELVGLASRRRAPGDLASLRDLWQQLRQLSPGPRLRDEFLLFPLFPAMVKVADDPLWAEYAAELLATIPTTLNPIHITQRLPGIERPSLQPRLAPILRAMVTAAVAKSYNLEAQAKLVAHTAWLVDDSATLRFLAEQYRRLPDEKLTPGLKTLLADCQLLAGDPEAAFPLLWARPGPGGQWTILWSMAGVPPESAGLGCDSTALDGVFDLTILAAPDTFRFKQLTTITKAKASGSVVLTLPEGTTTLSLTAIEPATRAVLRTAPLALSSAKMPAFEIPAVQPGEPDLRKLPSPFGGAEPVVGFDLSSTRSVEIATLPWAPGQSQKLSAWVLSSGGARLTAQALDHDGKALDVQVLAASSGNDSLPRWRLVQAVLDPKLAAKSDKLVLTASYNARQPSETPREPSAVIWFTDVRLETEPKSPP